MHTGHNRLNSAQQTRTSRQQRTEDQQLLRNFLLKLSRRQARRRDRAVRGPVSPLRLPRGTAAAPGQLTGDCHPLVRWPTLHVSLLQAGDCLQVYCQASDEGLEAKVCSGLAAATAVGRWPASEQLQCPELRAVLSILQHAPRGMGRCQTGLRNP